MTGDSEAWFLGVSLVLVLESFLVAMRFIHGVELREMLCFKGSGGLASIKLKFIFKLLANNAGNLCPLCDCLTSCDRNAKQ